MSKTLAEINAEIDALQDQRNAIYQAEAEQRRAQAIAEAQARHADAFAGIAAEVDGNAEKVGAFLAKVAQESGFSLDYLVSVITGQPNQSTTAWGAM